jgi:2-polyprenyl-6-methoxyphenol hydroxylase-like FAD-dependent oxidoreductase
MRQGAACTGLSTGYVAQAYLTPEIGLRDATTFSARSPSASQRGERGYKIDVRGTALQVLRRMGLHDVVVAASTAMQGALLVDKDGKVIKAMSGDAFGHRAGEDVEIIHGALCQILMDHVSEAEFIFGDSLQSISQSCDGVRVEFRMPSARQFDFVIGADGLHSNVRALVFGEARRFVHELGLNLCVYTVPN